jgi:hypothetical protein
MKKIPARRMTVEEILAAARSVRAQVKRELTDEEIDYDKRQGRAGEELLKRPGTSDRLYSSKRQTRRLTKQSDKDAHDRAVAPQAQARASVPAAIAAQRG